MLRPYPETSAKNLAGCSIVSEESDMACGWEWHTEGASYLTISSFFSAHWSKTVSPSTVAETGVRQ